MRQPEDVGAERQREDATRAGLTAVRAKLEGEVPRVRARLALALFGDAQAAPRLGRYELGHRIAAGGMGVVWSATDPVLHRTVAIKLLHADGAEPQNDRRRLFLRETRALARISHTNVLQVFDVGTSASPTGDAGDSSGGDSSGGDSSSGGSSGAAADESGAPAATTATGSSDTTAGPDDDATTSTTSTGSDGGPPPDLPFPEVCPASCVFLGACAGLDETMIAQCSEQCTATGTELGDTCAEALAVANNRILAAECDVINIDCVDEIGSAQDACPPPDPEICLWTWGSTGTECSIAFDSDSGNADFDCEGDTCVCTQDGDVTATCPAAEICAYPIDYGELRALSVECCGWPEPGGDEGWCGAPVG